MEPNWRISSARAPPGTSSSTRRTASVARVLVTKTHASPNPLYVDAQLAKRAPRYVYATSESAPVQSVVSAGGL